MRWIISTFALAALVAFVGCEPPRPAGQPAPGPGVQPAHPVDPADPAPPAAPLPPADPLPPAVPGEPGTQPPLGDHTAPPADPPAPLDPAFDRQADPALDQDSATVRDPGPGTTLSRPEPAGATPTAPPATGGADTTPAPGTRPDDTGVNVRDQARDAATAEQQSNEQAHLDMTARIRQRVVNLENVSVNAANVKIITTATGRVILRGPVANEAERSQIEVIAREEAGAGNVENHLEIAP